MMSTTRKPPPPTPTLSNSPDEWLSLADIAAELRIPLATVYRWNSQRQFRTARFGKHVRVRRTWLEEWINDRAA
jgi:excisionase family DNA binding protein